MLYLSTNAHIYFIVTHDDIVSFIRERNLALKKFSVQVLRDRNSLILKTICDTQKYKSNNRDLLFVYYRYIRKCYRVNFDRIQYTYNEKCAR